MKRILWIAFFMHGSYLLSAQDFPGYRTGNYTGVNGVFFNPANIADSRYRWDVNLLSLNTSLGNNQASFSLKNFNETFKGDSIKNQLFGDEAGAASGQFSLDMPGPSVMFNVGRQMSFAITTRARALVNIRDIDGKLASKVIDDFENDASLPYTISSANNMQVNVTGWTEFGISAGRILMDEGNHFLKGGLSLKYLAGAANGHIYINEFNGTINQDLVMQDAYLSNTTGRLGLGFGGVSLDDFEAGDLLSFKSTGAGFDIGLVYEFRPRQAGYRQADSSWRRDLNKYTLRIGLALLDIGSIKYTRDMQRSGVYDIGITGAERFYLSELDDLDIDDYNSFFQSRPQYFTPVANGSDESYKVAMPSTMQVDVDYHAHKGFYINLAGQIALTKTGSKPYNTAYYSGLTLTPRYESRAFGVYVPVNYNELTDLNAGLSLRAGPFFVGSGSVFTALLGNSKRADVYFGWHVAGLHKRK